MSDTNTFKPVPLIQIPKFQTDSSFSLEEHLKILKDKSPSPGILSITVEEAKNIKGIVQRLITNYNFLIKNYFSKINSILIIGTMEQAFCVIHFAGKRFETKIKKDTTYPKWRETFSW